MVCKSCIDKWIEYYLHKGFSSHKASKMAKNLVKRVERRLEREDIPYEPMYLIERANEGITLIHRKPRKLFNFLYKWCFRTQWRPVFWYGIREGRFLKDLKFKCLFWVGKGFNPDYTLSCNACVLGGDTSCSESGYCAIVATCRIHTCTTGCLPLPNSTCTNTCACTPSGCKCVATVCQDPASFPPTCAGPTGLCSCTCTPPYVWNGVACVSGVVTTKLWMTLKGRGGDVRQRLRGRKTLKRFLSMCFRS